MIVKFEDIYIFKFKNLVRVVFKLVVIWCVWSMLYLVRMDFSCCRMFMGVKLGRIILYSSLGSVNVYCWFYIFIMGLFFFNGYWIFLIFVIIVVSGECVCFSSFNEKVLICMSMFFFLLMRYSWVFLMLINFIWFFI